MSGVSTSDRRPRILFLAGCWFPDHENPFSGIFIKRHSEAVARYADVAVLHLAPSSNFSGRPRVAKETLSGFEVFHVRHRALPSARWGVLRSQITSWKAGLLGCRVVSQDWGLPDILHVHVVPSLSFVLAARHAFPGRPLMVTEHWTGYLPESGEVLGLSRRLYTRWLTRRAAAVTAVSEDLADAMRAKGFGGRYHVIPNVVDTDVFRPPDSQPEPRPFRFVHVSLLRPVKNIVPTIRLVGRLVRSGQPAELHIVGEGPEKEKAVRTAKHEGLLDNEVIFHGGQGDLGIAECLRNGHALVLLSDYENSPCVIGEAMACGLPVLATRVGGVPELVSSQRGLLVPAGDWQAAEAAMRQMIENVSSFDRSAIRAYAVERFSSNAVGRAFAALYQTTLGGRP